MRFSRKYRKRVPPKAASKGMPIPRCNPKPNFRALVLLATAAALTNMDAWNVQSVIEPLELGELNIAVEELEFKFGMRFGFNIAFGTSSTVEAKAEPFCMNAGDVRLD